MLNIAKDVVKSIPGVMSIYRRVQERRERIRLEGMPAEEVFTEMFVKNETDGEDGPHWAGSDRIQTRNVVTELPRILREVGATTVVDAGCGDFYWMQHVDLSGFDYLGVDIVKLLVERNGSKFETDRIRFKQLDLLTQAVPHADVVLCRDVFVHFSYKDMARALANIRQSGSKYLLATTYTAVRKNQDIATGWWRKLNLEQAPLNMPKPERVFVEGCTEVGGANADKSLALWRLSDIGGNQP